MKKVIKALEKQIEYIIDKKASNEFNSGKKAGLELAIDIIHELYSTPPPDMDMKEIEEIPERSSISMEIIDMAKTINKIIRKIK